MSTQQSVGLESDETRYQQDDIARSLRIALAAVFLDALANEESDPAFLRGVLSLTRNLTALYCIPWDVVLTSLRDTAAFRLLEQRLQSEERQE